MKLSNFVHDVSLGKGRYALFHSLLLQTVIVSKEVRDILFTAPNRVLDFERMSRLEKVLGFKELVEQKFLFEMGQNIDEEIYLKVRVDMALSQQKAFGLIYLMLTDDCNLRCKYCFIENPMEEKYQRSSMSFEVAKERLEHFACMVKKNNPDISPQIMLYGGEPFLNYSVMQKVITKIDDMIGCGQLSKNTSVSINTNGTLIGTDEAIFLSKFKNLFISISLDGYKDSHNSNRIYLNGKTVTEKVLETIHLLERFDINYGISCTVTEANLKDLKKISSWFSKNLKTKTVGFNMLIDDSTEYSESKQRKYSHSCSTQMLKCFEYFRAHGIHEDRIMRKAKAFCKGSIYYNDCGACGQQMVVSPDGMIGVCHAYCYSKKYFINYDSKFDPFLASYWKEWRFRSPLFIDDCKKCISLGLCGGGCPYNAEKREGSIWNLDKMFCIHSKKTIKYLVREVSKKALNRK